MHTPRFAWIRKILAVFEDPINTLTLALFGCLLFFGSFLFAGEVTESLTWQQYGAVIAFLIGSIVISISLLLFAVSFFRSNKHRK